MRTPSPRSRETHARSDAERRGRAALRGCRSRGPWYCLQVATSNLKELLALDVQSRLALVQELWDSILQDVRPGELLISDAERRQLDDRLQEDDQHPADVMAWPDARARLRTRP